MTDAAENSVLFLDSVSKRYTEQRNTPFEINNFTLKIHSGELVRLRGNSGTGKTTILRIAGLLAKPDSGTVYICGQPPRDATHCDQLRSHCIGVVFQENYLFKHLTVVENLRIADLTPYQRG